MLSVNRPCGLTSARTETAEQNKPTKLNPMNNTLRGIASLLVRGVCRAVFSGYPLRVRLQEGNWKRCLRPHRLLLKHGTGRRGRSNQSVDAERVVVEQLLLFLVFAPADDALECLDPLPVRGGQGADRPVAAEHDAVGAENFE